jgi:hypothetical protein
MTAPITKPIPTIYAGISFRSRLEASYAATFDSIGLRWQYEPEGYVLSDGTWYLPDFYLSSARAWLEVKGDHEERISKVERFAADLWESAGQPDYDSPDAPMVILAGSPVPVTKGYDHSHYSPHFVGVRGPGKGCSVGLARCPHCHQRTFIALWPRLCRACGHVHEDGNEAWVETVSEHWLETRFVHVRHASPSDRVRSHLASDEVLVIPGPGLHAVGGDA